MTARKNRFFACLFVFFWCCSQVYSLAQDAPGGAPRSLDIGIPAARIYPNETGEFVVCLQEIPKESDDNVSQTNSEKRIPQSNAAKRMTRVVVVDMKAFKVVATRDFPTRGSRELEDQIWRPVAVGRMSMFLQEDDDGITQLRLPDLQTVNRTPAVPGYFELLAIGDRLLCSSNGNLRLDLPAMTPTQKWLRPDYLKSNRPPHDSFRVIRPIADGWLIDDRDFDSNWKLVAITPWWLVHKERPGDPGTPAG